MMSPSSFPSLATLSIGYMIFFLALLTNYKTIRPHHCCTSTFPVIYFVIFVSILPSLVSMASLYNLLEYGSDEEQQTTPVIPVPNLHNFGSFRHGRRSEAS
ncbi:uncharacterized protein BDCG_16609 [Blastomyces dermatitidis ER-3]|uniref:Uncharacterized protein n=1 Tax=Ajellomyces dermatitidis (strain ER-3 / ATCC MYA-2586) TaxID=559297 RepID=A0ABP2EXT0_AJEDR|nr:uncharacterized protein BDCG_16609 [Blastomyces dermatitidis ER-3]EEQ87521.2 hypothetical protein BDCG_16609 [Blastomyces dermatitidis ER-3]